MSTVEDFANALEQGNMKEAERHLTDMPASELRKVGDALDSVGQHNLAAEVNERAGLRALGEAGVRIRVPIRRDR